MKREIIRVATFAEHTNNQEKVIGIFFDVKNKGSVNAINNKDGV